MNEEKIAFYSRVSTEEQNTARQKLDAVEGWRFFEDIGESAFSKPIDKRPDGSRLINECRQGKITKIVVSEASRLTRSYSEYIRLTAFFMDFRIQVHIQKLGVDLFSDINGKWEPNPKAILPSMIDFYVAFNESWEKSRRNKQKSTQLKRDGHRYCSSPDFGDKRKQKCIELLQQRKSYQFIQDKIGISPNRIAAIKREITSS